MARARYDVIVIGGGPAGTAAALRAAELGLATLCVDERPRAGGTCLHVGCIPSKALLDSTRRLAEARFELPEHGVSCGELSIRLGPMMARKQAVVDELTDGLVGLLEKAGVELARGRAELLGGGRVGIRNGGSSRREVEGDHLLLATGSTPVRPDGLPEDDACVFTSREALSLESVPDHLAVIGGGYIGLELGSVWKRLGADVTILELADRVLPEMDEELSRQAKRSLEAQGLAIRLECEVGGVERSNGELRLALGGKEAGELSCSHVLVAVGRRPFTRGLGLDAAGVALDARGFVRTDGRFRTSAPGIFAIGDVAGQPMLAHKGQLEGVACVDAIAGRGSGHVSYESVPKVVYTWPEVASLGATEAELRSRGVRHRVGRASFRHNSRALCSGNAEGFVKLLAEEGSGRLLGAHLFSPDAGTLIHELVVALELGGSVEEVGRSVHAHPTLNESIREAALAARR